jgi:hypothetical protein
MEFEYDFIYFSDGRVIRDGREGFVTKPPAFSSQICLLSFGKTVDSFILDADCNRINLSDEDLKNFTDELFPLLVDDSFKISDLNNEMHDIDSSIEATDYVEKGIAAGTLNESDYAGVVADRITWKARKVEILAEIDAINKEREASNA